MKRICEANEWEKSGLNEKVGYGEVEFALVYGLIICELACSVSLVSSLLNFRIKILIPACQTSNSFVCHKKMLSKLK